MKLIKTLFVLLIALTVAVTASAYNFTKDLEFGAEGNDVVELQQMLSAAGYLEMPADAQYGYFGKATEFAVAKWQIASGITPISGIFGPKSRAVAGLDKAPERPMSADTTNYTDDYVGIPERSQYLNKNQYNWFSEKLISAGYVPEKLGEKILQPLNKMTKNEILSWALVLQQNGRITQSLYGQIKSTLLGGGSTQFKLTSPNNGESYQLASRIGNTLSGQEKNVYVIDWTGGSLSNNEQAGDVIRAFLEKKVGNEYIMIGRIPALAYGSIHSLAGYIAPTNCSHTYYHEGNWGNSCVNSDNYSIVEPGQYFIRLLDTKTGLTDRSDEPITFTYGSQSGSYGKYLFTRDLTLGSTGPDVVALQDIMISFSFLDMPVGYDKGYFGSQLKTAVAKWQASIGMSPATGYFGPIARAYISAKQGRENNAPVVNYVQAPAGDKNVLYSGEKATVYGKNLNSDRIRVFLSGKAMGEEIDTFAQSNNSISFMVPNDMSESKFELFLGGSDVVRSNSITVYFERKVEVTPKEPYFPPADLPIYDSKTSCESATKYVCEKYEYTSQNACLALEGCDATWETAWRPTSVKIAPVVTPVKLTPAQICAVVQKPTTSTCVRTYPIFKGAEKITGYVYQGFKYDISYNKYANSKGAVCRDTCTAKAY